MGLTSYIGPLDSEPHTCGVLIGFPDLSSLDPLVLQQHDVPAPYWYLTVTLLGYSV